MDANGTALSILSRRLLSDQFADRLAVFHDVARAALMIEIRGVERHAHVVINGRGNIAGGDWPLLDRAAIAFGRANDLPVTEASLPSSSTSRRANGRARRYCQGCASREF